MGDIKDFLKFFGVIILISIVILSIIVILFNYANKQGCADLQSVTGRKTEYRFYGGCFVEDNKEMLPYEKWKILDVKIKEGK